MRRSALGILRGKARGAMNALRMRIYLDRQRLELADADRIVATYPVSTARNGPGERHGSYCTPRGLHVVRAKVGAGCPANTVFVRRRPTGEIWTPELASRYPGRDWMLTRILWLSGRERGFNRGGGVDSLRRKIYIHGTGEESTLGSAASRGCIRMSNADVVALFDRVAPGTEVDIVESSAAPFRVRIAEWSRDGAAIQHIRHEVFVREQGLPQALAADASDPACLHVAARDEEGAVIGCGRVLADGSIGRIAVERGWRGRGVGDAMVARLIDVAAAAGLERVALDARSDAQDFYAQRGFRPVGAEFMEAGIRHRRMERILAPVSAAQPGGSARATEKMR
jgi:predicted GNAT family N-acyltransferase/lipoprotein-anchoring transpeptidase ErfK/SrfK